MVGGQAFGGICKDASHNQDADFKLGSSDIKKYENTSFDILDLSSLSAKQMSTDLALSENTPVAPQVLAEPVFVVAIHSIKPACS
jgi:hypothetical protein